MEAHSLMPLVILIGRKHGEEDEFLKRDVPFKSFRKIGWARVQGPPGLFLGKFVMISYFSKNGSDIYETALNLSHLFLLDFHLNHLNYKQSYAQIFD